MSDTEHTAFDKTAGIQIDIPSDEEETDLSNYEIVAGEFFAQTKEPAFTINVNKVYVNTAAVRLLSSVDYVKYMINREEKKLVIKPCSEMDIQGYRWVRTKDGKRYPSQRTGQTFVESLCMLMGWNPLFRYKITGKKNKAKDEDGEDILAFDLMAVKCFERELGKDGKVSRQTALPEGWNGSFGPRYGDYHRTLQVKTFNGYTVFSLKGNEQQVIENPEIVEGTSAPAAPPDTTELAAAAEASEE